MYFTSRLVTAEERMLQVNNTGNLTVVMPKNYLESKFNNFMTLCAMVPLLIFSCLNSVLHQRVPQKVRIMGSLAIILLLFLVTAVLVKISILPLSFFVLTMITIVCINSFGAILQGSLFGLAGLLPASYTTPIMSGQGLAGTFAAFAMICAIASGSALQDSAFGYFITACAVILIAIGSYIALPKMEFFLFYLNKDSSPSTSSNDGETKLDLLKKAEHTNGADNKAVISLPDDLHPQVSVVAILKKPGSDSFLLPIMVVARVVFVPLFMLCNVQPRENLPVLFGHDAWYIVFMILFAFSNGYLASLCMCFGPKKVAPHEAETTGAIMAFFLSLGLALGATVSFLFRALV
ncbi:Equilibrative nucleoside transporter 1 [Acipenser ruthenus]|uniref:Equilibrative nucleoside transporter 1 n=1 Tax=Acipenser ruthenus TaxID=7906 RepID=A0A444UER4_ACIRT|nr:Equilibrative nucleoside transporter 1 [Acipenser ruthenus]